MPFIPDFSTIAQFAVATFIIAITPGPDMTLFVGRALSQGRSAGLACMAGAMSGIVIHTSLVVLGLSALIVAAPAAFLALKVVGAAYLVWLAFNAIRHGSAFRPEKMEGGLDNPLGARAMYLGSTQYRIHGTNQPNSIGKAASSGCFRMANEDVEHLYASVTVGTKVIVRE